MGRGALIAVLVVAGASVGRRASAEDQPPLRIGVATRGIPALSKKAKKLRRLVREAAQARPEIPLAPQSVEMKLFAAQPPPSAGSAIARVETLVGAGQEALRNFDLPAAERKLAKATRALGPYLGLPETKKADRARIFLGVSLAHARRDEGALTSLLAEYATRYPDENPTNAGWPPDVMERLKTLRRLPQSSIIVRSKPAAEIKVDGRQYGPTPQTIAPIPAGRHRIVAEAPGYYRADAWVTAPEAKTAEIDLELSPDTARRLARDKAKTETPNTIEAIQRAAAASELRAVLVVSTKSKGRMVLSYVDLSGHRARTTARFEVAATKDGATTAMSQLSLHLAKVGDKKEVVPLWAWIGAGTGVAAVGTGVALRLAAQSTQDELIRKTGAVTQAEAFDMRDRAQAQARGGAILVSAGVAAVVGVAGWVLIDQIGGDP